MVGNTLVDRRFFLFARSKGPPGFRLGSLGKVKMSRLYPSTSPLLWFFHFGKKKREKKKALALHDFERKSGFVDNLLVSPLLEKEQQSVFTAFMDDDIS